tara:strand:- start:1577 stop:1777 length:201 start_codon:yes stop_codon:yes gene_type:complete
MDNKNIFNKKKYYANSKFQISPKASELPDPRIFWPNLYKNNKNICVDKNNINIKATSKIKKLLGIK